jgi:hypothetical protein
MLCVLTDFILVIAYYTDTTGITRLNTKLFVRPKFVRRSVAEITIVRRGILDQLRA